MKVAVTLISSYCHTSFTGSVCRGFFFVLFASGGLSALSNVNANITGPDELIAFESIVIGIVVALLTPVSPGELTVDFRSPSFSVKGTRMNVYRLSYPCWDPLQVVIHDARVALQNAVTSEVICVYIRFDKLTRPRDNL